MKIYEKYKKPKVSFLDSLNQISDLAKTKPEIKIKEIFKILLGKGYAALLVLFSLPFCAPIQIPGFSTPFGLILAFLGLRIAFAKRLWWPAWVLEKSLSSQSVDKVAAVTSKAVRFLQKILHPRLQFLTKSPIFHRLNGLLICILGLFLSLPLPIPMTNLLAAGPILLIGLGLLEDDGLFILMGYAFFLLSLSLLIGLFLLGKAQLASLMASS